MKTNELNYDLPTELIAQAPLSVRSDSRLLVLDRSSGNVLDSRFDSIGEFLLPGDCLVLNDTKVLPARFFARRATGGNLEGLFLSTEFDNVWIAYMKGIHKLGQGEEFYLKDRQKVDFCEVVLLEKLDQGKCRLKIKADMDARAVLEKIGFPPLPPYIKRDDDPMVAEEDKQRYQTVYARQNGAVAAPTAGLHFTKTLIGRLKRSDVKFAFITLHVGAGTFKPVTEENLENHEIHEEWFSIDEENAAIINTAKSKGGRIIPVGTTSTRVLETVAVDSRACPERSRGIKATSGMTELFIMPGYQFRLTGAMITNFHLPKSTLLALVAAFAGLENILAAYNHAIEQRYRFYSYGDAMLII